jgi:hypothetical protein
MVQLRNHFLCINFCSPKTDNMPTNFLCDARCRRLVTEVNFAGKSSSFSVLARISLQSSYRTSKPSVSSAWTSCSVCRSQVNAYAGIWKRYSYVAANQVLLDALMSVVCVGSKPKHGQGCIRSRRPTRINAFKNAPFSLKGISPCLKGYSAWLLRAKLWAKCTLHSCYCLFFRQLQNTPSL